ncbi:MAG TPA: aspartate aminotransferase family protein [Candidatus Sulfotelmatobacter sp.]|jgi:4-aminobutyrate--pyruvate transaminase|nr:aspartate aminotransferase family protein [Candidatus Sulfotelmatobacter sp.]
MVSNSLRDKDLAYTLHPYTNLRAHEKRGPLILVRGEGVRVFDEQGKSYIESMAGLWCASLGFSEHRLAEAAKRQMDALPFAHQFSHKAHEPGIELAERLIAMAPVPMSKVFFANSGSEANDTVIKMVWYFNNALGRPEKKKIISRRKGYHGVTVAAASMTALPVNQRGFDLPIDRILHADTPHAYHEALPGEDDEAFATRLADNLEKQILAEGPETVAAFYAEPIMGAGGVIVPPKTYYPKIKAVCAKYDVLTVADEVICGFFRTGNAWGSTTMDYTPDILTCAKALSSAYLPISAVMVTDRIYQAIADASAALGSFGHGYTYSAHPVPAAVAIETLKIYEERDIGAHVRDVGAHMQKRLQELASHPLVGEKRGVALIGALELVEDKATRKNFDPARGVAAKVIDAMERRGVIGRNLMNDTLAFSPPLIIAKAEIDEMLDRVQESLDEVASSL